MNVNKFFGFGILLLLILVPSVLADVSNPGFNVNTNGGADNSYYGAKITPLWNVTLTSIQTLGSTATNYLLKNSTNHNLTSGTCSGNNCVINYTLYTDISAVQGYYLVVNQTLINYTNGERDNATANAINWDFRYYIAGSGDLTADFANGVINIKSVNYTNVSFPVQPSGVVVNSPSNNSAFYVGNHNYFDVNVSANNFGGNINLTVNLYNSSYSLVFSNLSFGNSSILNITGLSVGTYYLNATATNGTANNFSSTVTLHIYNSTSGVILSPVSGYNSSSRFLNISWSNATFIPVNVSISNTTVSLLNDDLTTNRTISSLAGVFNNYTYDLYIQNLSIGRYWIRLQQTDANGNTVTTQNRFNLTTNTLLNISARTTTGSIINNFSINAYNAQYDYNVTINTTNGIAYVDQKRGSINLTIDAEGYSTNFSKANIQVNTANYTYQFTLYETNTFNITFYNQANPTVLLSGMNISLDLISNLYAQNYTTQTGGLYLTLLIPETYTIRYYAAGFTTRFYYFTLNNRSYNEIKLYLINNSANYNYTVYVVNQVLNPVEGAIVKNLKYDLATNSYLVQEIGITDVAGKTTFTVTFNDEYYKQVVEYPSGTLKKTTTPDYIDTPSVVIPISLGDNNIVEDVVNYAGISGTLVFNNLTNNFRFDWSDTSLVASQYCLEVYRMTGLSQTLYNNSCSSGSSAGTILLGVANGSGYVYYAQATYFEDSVEKYLTSLYHEYPTPAVDEPLGNKYGLFIQLILTLGMTSLVVLNIGLAMVLAPFSLIIGKILGWNVFTWAGLLALQMVGIILAILSSMRR